MPRGPLQVTPEMQRLIDKPGYLGASKGGQRLRQLYSDNSLAFNADQDLSPFGLLCYLGALEEVKKAVKSGDAPDLFGVETGYKSGYLTIVVLGSQRVAAVPGISNAKQYVATMKFLLESGCPTEAQDVVGYTALMHSCINLPVPELTRVLAEAGADVNHRNKFGAVALLEACMQNSVQCVGILMEHGASMDIGDGDGITASKFYKLCGPAVVAEVSKWLRIRSGEDSLLQEKSCDFCHKSSKVPNVKLSLCSRCRLRRYCSPACQRNDWKSHKRSCKPFNAENTTVTFKPTYIAGETAWNHAEMTRAVLNMRNPVSIPALEPNFKDMSTVPMDVSDGRQFIIKVQLPIHDTGNSRQSMMVYNHKRNFRCHIDRELNEAQYDRLKDVIREKGAMGLKAYFMAELKNKEELLVQTEVIAEQAW